jgi:hypothetical protein
MHVTCRPLRGVFVQKTGSAFDESLTENSPQRFIFLLYILVVIAESPHNRRVVKLGFQQPAPLLSFKPYLTKSRLFKII